MGAAQQNRAAGGKGKELSHTFSEQRRIDDSLKKSKRPRANERIVISSKDKGIPLANTERGQKKSAKSAK